MPCGDSKQGEGWPFWAATTLLPVSQGMNAYPEGLGELFLGQTDEAPESDNIFASFDAPAQNPLPLLTRDRPGKILFC